MHLHPASIPDWPGRLDRYWLLYGSAPLLRSPLSPVDPAYTEPAPPRVHALPVERATATVPDRQHRPDPEPDAHAVGDEGAVGLVHRAAVDAPGRGRSAPVERDLARAKPGEVVVEVLVWRLDHVVERLACSAKAQLLVHREHAAGGADDGEHAPAHLEVERVEGGHSPTEVPRFPADVLDREVDGERRGPIRRQLELARREDEVLGAVGGLERVVRQREARDRHSHLAFADGQLRVGVQRDVLAARRERQARRAPACSVEVRPPELVVCDEAVAGVCGRRHDPSPLVCAPGRVPPIDPPRPRPTRPRRPPRPHSLRLRDDGTRINPRGSSRGRGNL